MNTTTHTLDNFLNYGVEHDFGEIHCHMDKATGMRAVIAIHNTALGPSLGGCRFINYPNNNTAILDAMRLARGMSYKSALAKLPLGGGKAVIIKPETTFDRHAYFKQFGKWVQQLNGRYITALDSGTELADMDIISKETQYIASLSRNNGDPAPFTASGVLRGIEAAVYFKLGKTSLTGLHIAIQGLGHVGYALAELLYNQGVKLSVADVDATRVQAAVDRLNATAVAVESIHKIPCDVFSPCALGGILNDVTIEELQTTIVAGAANNQLLCEDNGQQLHAKGILYAPDYAINAGGVIFAASCYFNHDQDIVMQKIDNIYDTLLEIFTQSITQNTTTMQVADNLAQAILHDAALMMLP